MKKNFAAKTLTVLLVIFATMALLFSGCGDGAGTAKDDPWCEDDARFFGIGVEEIEGYDLHKVPAVVAYPLTYAPAEKLACVDVKDMPEGNFSTMLRDNDNNLARIYVENISDITASEKIVSIAGRNEWDTYGHEIYDSVDFTPPTNAELKAGDIYYLEFTTEELRAILNATTCMMYGTTLTKFDWDEPPVYRKNYFTVKAESQRIRIIGVGIYTNGGGSDPDDGSLADFTKSIISWVSAPPIVPNSQSWFYQDSWDKCVGNTKPDESFIRFHFRAVSSPVGAGNIMEFVVVKRPDGVQANDAQDHKTEYTMANANPSVISPAQDETFHIDVTLSKIGFKADEGLTVYYAEIWVRETSVNLISAELYEKK